VFEFKLPDLGEGIHEGEILHWHVNVGDDVAEDDPVVEVETDKAAVTIPAPVAGRIVSVSGAIGETIAVGSLLAVIEARDSGAARAPAADHSTAAGGNGSAPAASEIKIEVQLPPRAPAPAPAARPPQPPTPGPPTPGRPIAAAPATRRLARELGVELADVPASGPGGRTTADDVRRFAEGGSLSVTGSPASATTSTALAAPILPASTAGGIPFLQLEPLPDFSQWGLIETEPVRSIRKKVAHKMVTSMTIVPHVAHMDEADVTELEAFRRSEREQRKGEPGGRLTLLAFVIKAVVAQLRQRPQFNASLDPFRQELIYKKYYNVGFAADTEKGLIVPVVHDADRKSIMQVSADIERIATDAREGKIALETLRGGTFTVTNVGSLGGTGVIPTINYPEVAILGMGMARPKPVVRDGEIVARTILPLTLTFDHRVIDGADAARFMTALVRSLSNPNVLMLES